VSTNDRKALRWKLRVWFVGVERRLAWQSGDTVVTRAKAFIRHRSV